MRITELVNTLDVGGVERQVVDLTLALRRMGHEVSVVCLRHTGVLAGELQRAGVEVIALEKPEGPDVGTLLRFMRHLRRSRAQVVHSHNPLVHHYAVLAGRLVGVPAIVNTIHGIDNLSANKGRKERLFGLMSRASGRIVAVCPMAQRAFLAARVIPAHKLEVIDNGIPLAPFLDVPARVADTTTVFGIVGRLVQVKDHRTLLQAFGELLSTRPDCRLELLGDGPQRASLEAQAHDLGIAPKVLFRGFSPDVAGFLADIDVSVLCSISEGLPLSTLEAMAAARPVVSTAVGGAPDLITPGENGWLCARSDPSALAAAMGSAVDAGSGRRQAMGRAGRQRAVANHSLERMAGRYESLFESLQ